MYIHALVQRISIKLACTQKKRANSPKPFWIICLVAQKGVEGLWVLVKHSPPFGVLTSKEGLHEGLWRESQDRTGETDPECLALPWVFLKSRISKRFHLKETQPAYLLMVWRCPRFWYWWCCKKEERGQQKNKKNNKKKINNKHQKKEIPKRRIHENLAKESGAPWKRRCMKKPHGAPMRCIAADWSPPLLELSIWKVKMFTKIPGL